MDYGRFKKVDFRRKFFKLFGAEIYIREADTDKDIGFIRMKAWKLREDVRLYTDRSEQDELFRIAARNIIDFGATYDVFDSSTDALLFSLRRKGLRSTFIRDHWELYDDKGNILGTVQETSGGLAVVRRWVGLIPFIGWVLDLVLMFIVQKYSIVITASGEPKTAGSITRTKNPLLVKMQLDTSDSEVTVDPKIPFAVTALLSVIDSDKN